MYFNIFPIPHKVYIMMDYDEALKKVLKHAFLLLKMLFITLINKISEISTKIKRIYL